MAAAPSHGDSPTHRVVEIITIGDELLLGYTIDTNGAYLARRLAEIGLAVGRRTSVGDRVAEIEDTVRQALERSGIVVTTGGLGPTADDMSKLAVANVFGRELAIDAEHVAWMRDRWRTRFGREMPESNVAQAAIPTGAAKLRNNHGSAPGIFLDDQHGRAVFMLPGVPREMRGMTDDVLIPLLSKRYPTGSVLRSLTIRTTGVAESLLGDRLREVPLPEGTTLAYLPSAEGVDLRLTTRNRPPDETDDLLAEAAAVVSATAGAAVYGRNDEDLAAVVLDLCRTRRLTLAVAESCTGGLLGARLTAIPRSSDVVTGGIIAYDNAVKRTMLGVSESDLAGFGAVSEPVAIQMATGARLRLGASLALSVTGIAGPGGGTPDKPVGTVWIGIAGPAGEARATRFSMIGDRDEVRRRSAQAALEMLRRHLA